MSAYSKTDQLDATSLTKDEESPSPKPDASLSIVDSPRSHEAEVFVVRWTGEDDPLDPLNTSSARAW